MEVVVGTYEEVLLGYRVTKVGEKFQFEQSFTDNSHTGCLKTVAISSKGILASGGTDETIKLFNLKKRLELGSLVHHSGTVVGLDFYKGNHLFSVSEDGTLAIWKYYTWECLKTLRGHKSAINGLSVHPSGKLALTVSRDKTLKTWNLIEGKCAYTTNLKSVADLVVWSTEGTYYAIVFQTRIDIYKIETAAIYSTVTVEKRPNALAFLSDNVLVYGCEGGSVVFHDIAENKQIHHIDTQTNRIRGLQIAKNDDAHDLLYTASSDGQIKLYQISQTQDSISSTLLAEFDSKFRLTCIAVHCPKQTVDKIEKKEPSDLTEEVDSKGDNSKEETEEKNKRKKKQKRTLEITETETVVKKKPRVEIEKKPKADIDRLSKKQEKQMKTEKQKRAEEKQVEKGFDNKEKKAKVKDKKRKKFLQRQKNKKIKV